MAKRPANTPETAPEEGTQTAIHAVDAGAANAAPAQNTEAPNDSPEGGAPAGAEGAISASGEDGALAGSEEGRDPSSGTNGTSILSGHTGELILGRVDAAPIIEPGTAGAANAYVQEGDRQMIYDAIARIGGDPGQLLPKSTGIVFLPRRRAWVASAIEHHGYPFKAGDPIPLTEAEFLALKDSGALIETDWDDLDEI